MVKPRVSQFQAEGVFPSQPIANSVSGLPIRQAFHKLKHCHQCQAPGSFGGLTMCRKQIGKAFISVDGTKRVTELHHDMSMRECCVSYTSGYSWYRWNRMRFKIVFDSQYEKCVGVRMFNMRLHMA